MQVLVAPRRRSNNQLPVTGFQLNIDRQFPPKTPANWFPKGVAVLRAVMNLDTQTRVLG
jgi:hypothetical protein